jgi:hypothetical protein
VDCALFSSDAKPTMTPFLRQRKRSPLSPTAVMGESTPATTPLESRHSTLLSDQEIPEWYQDNKLFVMVIALYQTLLIHVLSVCLLCIMKQSTFILT